jgi:methylmalonyl-CoA mutase N-terminal domain/subunit
VVRVTLQALSAVLGGTQSLHTNGYDEALALPTEEAARLALRTQQILAHESGVARTVDPLAGSWYVEALTDELEKRAREYIARVDELGGAASAIDYMRGEIHRSAYRFQLEVERGERVVVGVNAFREEGEAPHVPQPDYSELETRQKEKLASLRARRSGAHAAAALASVRDAAACGAPLLPAVIEAVRALATLGEISDALREEWGTYDAAARARAAGAPAAGS